jgi:hypothetical protein
VRIYGSLRVVSPRSNPASDSRRDDERRLRWRRRDRRRKCKRLQRGVRCI